MDVEEFAKELAAAQDDLAAEFPMNKYEVLLYHHEADESPIDHYLTYGSWNIEGNFLITWMEDGRRIARRIPELTCFILTVEVKPEEAIVEDGDAAKPEETQTVELTEGIDADYADSAE